MCVCVCVWIWFKYLKWNFIYTKLHTILYSALVEIIGIFSFSCLIQIVFGFALKCLAKCLFQFVSSFYVFIWFFYYLERFEIKNKIKTRQLKCTHHTGLHFELKSSRQLLCVRTMTALGLLGHAHSHRHHHQSTKLHAFIVVLDRHTMALQFDGDTHHLYGFRWWLDEIVSMHSNGVNFNKQFKEQCQFEFEVLSSIKNDCNEWL